jgi:hypothetical protein
MSASKIWWPARPLALARYMAVFASRSISWGWV